MYEIKFWDNLELDNMRCMAKNFFTKPSITDCLALILEEGLSQTDFKMLF